MTTQAHYSQPRKPPCMSTWNQSHTPRPLPFVTLLPYINTNTVPLSPNTHRHTQTHNCMRLTIMATTDKSPGPTAAKGSEPTRGEAISVGQHVVDKGAMMLQSLKPIKQMSQHVCSFAIYSHDMSRQIETHHYCTRLNQDFLQCAVYDSDDSNGRLLGVEYVVSDSIFETLPPEEQKLWHSHVLGLFEPAKLQKRDSTLYTLFNE